ncbi:MAG: hypothetical protein ACOH2L_12270 [Devosia sp.]
MTYKEMNAAVMAINAVVVSAWVLLQALAAPALSVAEIAQLMCWAILASVVLNIVAVIVFTILLGIAQGRALKDERSDERDHAVGAKAMRNAYVVASVGGLISLIVLAMGHEVATGLYVLFGGLMLAGAIDGASRLVYYRVG